MTEETSQERKPIPPEERFRPEPQERASVPPVQGVKLEPPDRTFIPPEQRFKPAGGMPIARIGAFMPQRDRKVPIMEGAMQPSEFTVDERTQSQEHFEILTYKRIRDEVVAELTKKPGAPPASAPGPVEELTRRLEAAAGRPAQTLPEPRRTEEAPARGAGPSMRMAEERILELEEERAVLLRLAGKLGDQIDMLREHSRPGEERIAR